MAMVVKHLTLTSSAEEKDTYGLHLLRKDSGRPDKMSSFHLQAINDKEVYIEFQCDKGTKPQVFLMELLK